MFGRFLFLMLTFLLFLSAKTQDNPYFVKNYPDTLNKQRVEYVIGGQSAIYAGSLTLLYYAWYKDYPRSSFQFFNDNDEWLQMDKAGHVTTAAYFGKFGYEMYRWAGIKRNKAIWIGGSTGFIFLTVIEILDGYSAEWGASWGDFVSNAAGSAFFIGQQFAWDDQRFSLKYSFHQTGYTKYNPDQLGDNLMENMLKDYNGQSYWLSGNIKAFLPRQSRFPGWLNVSLGYSAEGMLGAKTNPSGLPDYQRYRQYFLSLDVDLARIKTNSHFLKFVLNGINFIKIPFPALEYNQIEGFRFHPVYF
jgi:uncharacterized protein YfiM (DUF2279 family)